MSSIRLLASVLFTILLLPAPLMNAESETSNAVSPRCAVTIPNGIQPPVKDFGGTMTYSPNYKGPRSHTFPGSHGNGKLWTILPLDGKLLLARDADGSLSDKFMWWHTWRKIGCARGAIAGRRSDWLRRDWISGKQHYFPE